MIWIPLIWLLAFPVILLVNADLLLPYLMVTVYAGMLLLGWVVAASVMGGFASSALIMLGVGGVWIYYSYVLERRYKEETRGTNLGSMGRRAFAESIPTYCPAWMNLAAGAAAGALLGTAPGIFAILHGRFAPVDKPFGKGVGAFLDLGTSASGMWTMIIILAIIGVVAAYLRRSRGFARQMVWPLKNTYIRRRPDSALFDKFMLYWFPVLGFIMIAVASNTVFTVLMTYIFVWAFSGVIFRQIWSGMHIAVLKAMGARMERRLDYEYLLRVRLENESDLHSCTYSSIIVGVDGSVEVKGSFKGPERESAARILVESLVKGSQGKVTLVEEA